MKTTPNQPGQVYQTNQSHSPYRPGQVNQPGQPMAKWVLLPMRLFLGFTFIYAGMQKLADPQFFNPAAHGYIGKQIIAFATGSPLHDILIRLVPHATLFGAMVAFGEIAIGLGVLFGLLFRPAAFFGLLLSLVFFLSATWHVYPYFYGSDIVFLFCWLTLLLAGPVYTGLPTLDAFLVQHFFSPKQQAQLAPMLYVLLGVGERPKPVPTPSNYPQNQQYRQAPGNKRAAQQRGYSTAQRTKETRRNFLIGALTGGASILGLTWLWNTFHASPQATDNSATDTGTTAGTATPASTASSNGTSAVSGTTIAQANAVQNNSAVNFTLSSNGDPGILVRLNNGQFVAYDAVCTHAGCPVDYDPSSQLLICPCHGAEFDPTKSAAVVQGPADTPLTKVPVHVDSATGAITVSQ